MTLNDIIQDIEAKVPEVIPCKYTDNPSILPWGHKVYNVGASESVHYYHVTKSYEEAEGAIGEMHKALLDIPWKTVTKLYWRVRPCVISHSDFGEAPVYSGRFRASVLSSGVVK
jgi:hypothetical protein